MNFLIPQDPSSPSFQRKLRHNEIVRAGKIYEELDEFLKSASGVEPLSEIEPDESVYGELNGEHEMRVLELCAGEFDASLCFKTHVCSVEGDHTLHAICRATGSPIWYTALSYAWGSKNLVKPATCNGKSVKITVNLDLALRHLRRTDISVMLWVDQICINQDDPKEKTQQVLLMGTIYRRAWSTLVWLGEEADDTGDAMDLIVTISIVFQGGIEQSAPALEDFNTLGLPDPGSQQWCSLSRFLSRSWFHRMWVIQEVILSTYVQLQCGRKSISWSEMSMFAICIIQHDLTQYLAPMGNDPDQLPVRACAQVDRIWSISANEDESLLRALVNGRAAQATDPRDKVFGIMKLTTDTINPDYSKSVSEIYIEAARKILEVTGDLIRLICAVDHEQPSTCRPSWVPDWSSPRQTTSLRYPWPAGFEASRGSYMEFELVEDRLLVVGIVHDTVSNVLLAAGSCLKDVLNPTSTTAQFVIESMRMATKYCQPYPSHLGLFDAFWHTFVAGKDASGMLKAPSDFADIFALLIDSATGCTPSMPDQPVPSRRLTLNNLKVRRPSRIYRKLQIAFEAAVRGRMFGTSSKQYMGLFPRGTRPGDRISVPFGSEVPFVVRPWGTSGSFQLIGECYVHGIMDGEVMQMTDLKKEEIHLV